MNTLLESIVRYLLNYKKQEIIKGVSFLDIFVRYLYN